MSNRRNQYCNINVSGKSPSPRDARDYVYNDRENLKGKSENGFFEVKGPSFTEKPASTSAQDTFVEDQKGSPITVTFANKVSVTMHAGFSGKDLWTCLSVLEASRVV